MGKESSERESILISPPDKAWRKKIVWLISPNFPQATNKLQAVYGLDLTTLKVYTSESFSSSARSVHKAPPSSTPGRP